MGIKRRYRIQWTMALSVTLGGIAGQALAADPVQSPTDNNGLMSFPNVRVVNAPIADASTTGAEAGMRAYVDPQTGELTSAPSTEEAAKLSAAASAVRASAPARSAASGASSNLIYGPGNAVGMMLGEETMVFQVARLDDDGTVTQQCVIGEKAVQALVSSDVAGHDHEEKHND